MDVKIRMNLLGLPGKVEPLTEKAAVQLGSDLLSDFIVFGTALGIIMFEYYRQTRNSAKKEASIENKVGVIEFNKALLHENVENQTKSIEEINNMIQTNRSEIDILNKRIRRMEKRLNGESVLLDDIKEELTNKMDLLVTPVVKTLKKATPDALTGHINTLNDAFTKKSIINDSVNDAIKIMTNKQFY